MKVIDIHTGKKEVEGQYKNSIDRETVKNYIFQNIDFKLTTEMWEKIDNAFAEIWNNEIGIGGYFYWDEISASIYEDLKSQKILIQFERIDKITNLILNYIETTNGFLD